MVSNPSKYLITMSTSCRGHCPVRYASHSSNLWLERQKKDIYVRMARYDNYRARSAFKLIQLDEKYKFLQPGSIVIEAGAAPGSWTQVICERLKLTKDYNMTKDPKAGLCIAVDITDFEPVDGAICISNADFTSPFTQGKILSWLDDRRADCVLSDMAPAATGLKDFNHTAILRLIRSLVPFALQVLRPGGLLLFKIWDGSETNDVTCQLKESFDMVKHVKPKASRDDSTERYILCRGKKQRRVIADQ